MSDTTFLIDNFVAVQAGEPFRLFPFGRIFKGGRLVEITRALAQKFKLPHFKPPIKLGNHESATAAGGHIVALEVRDDGLYAVPEYNEAGLAALAAGAYRYHSPEIVWEGGSIENPETGEDVPGPFIVGDALLHTPHLGEATALYSVEIHGGETTMNENTVQVPASVWDRMLNFFAPVQPEPQQEPAEPTANIDEYVAQVENLQSKNTQLEARVQEMEAAEQRRAKVAKFATELKGVEAVTGNTDLFTALAGLDEDTAAQIVTAFKAVNEQAKAGNLTDDVGVAGGNPNDPYLILEAAVTDTMKEQNITYNEAISLLGASRPELFAEVL